MWPSLTRAHIMSWESKARTWNDSCLGRTAQVASWFLGEGAKKEGGKEGEGAVEEERRVFRGSGCERKDERNTEMFLGNDK